MNYDYKYLRVPFCRMYRWAKEVRAFDGLYAVVPRGMPLDSKPCRRFRRDNLAYCFKVAQTSPYAKSKKFQKLLKRFRKGAIILPKTFEITYRETVECRLRRNDDGGELQWREIRKPRTVNVHIEEALKKGIRHAIGIENAIAINLAEPDDAEVV